MNPLLEALRALAEPTRLRILAICAQAELTVSELTRVLGQSQPRVSRHLKLLCDAGVLERFREQTFAYFRIARAGAGSDIAQAILELVPSQDTTYALDSDRVKEELSTREQEAAEILLKLGAELKAARKDQPSASALERVVHKLIGSADLGELLEIGTGTGGMLQLLAKQAQHAVGIDISPQMLRVARAQIQRAGIADHVAVRLGDMHHLQYANQSFDMICLDRVLVFADDPREVIHEMARLLRPEGRMVIIEVIRDDRQPEAIESQKLCQWLTDRGMNLDKQDLVKGPGADVLVWSGRLAQKQFGVA